MCMQCVAKSVSYGNVLPGFNLQKATRTSYEGTSEEGQWKKDQWALVECNDPSFYFSVEPIKRDEPKGEFGLYSQEYYDAANQIDEDIHAGNGEHPDSRVIWRLIEAARTKGYEPGHGEFNPSNMHRE